jgi:hypothetical protein
MAPKQKNGYTRVTNSDVKTFVDFTPINFYPKNENLEFGFFYDEKNKGFKPFVRNIKNFNYGVSGEKPFTDDDITKIFSGLNEKLESIELQKPPKQTGNYSTRYLPKIDLPKIDLLNTVFPKRNKPNDDDEESLLHSIPKNGGKNTKKKRLYHGRFETTRRRHARSKCAKV